MRSLEDSETLVAPSPDSSSGDSWRRPGSVAAAFGVVALVLAGAAPLAGQEAPRTAEIEELKARFATLLEQQDARHRAEIEALTKAIADLTARVRELEAERRASPPSATAGGGPTTVAAEPAPTPATTVPAVAAAAPPAKELPPEGHPLSASIPINIYGSLRFKSAIDSRGISEIQDNASRIGLKAEMPIGNTSSTAYARAEVGMRLMKSDSSVILRPDSSGFTATANNVFSARLGYVGFKTPVGTVTWGKQWSVYYDIGSLTDQFSVWGGEAQAAFNAGTDGGPSGTGLVDQAIVYRTPDAPLAVALQAQNRSLTDAGVRWGDTLGASVQWQGPLGLSLGAAWVDVRDGVREPDAGQPRKGDRSFIAGLKFYREPVYVAVSYARFENHEQDDVGTWFGGRGWELYVQVTLSSRWSIYGGMNDQSPDAFYIGRFRRRYVDAGARYVFHGTSFLFLEVKPEDSRNADGSRGRKNALAAGAFFNF